MITRTQDDGLIFAGDVYVRNRKLPGAGFINIGNVTEFKIKSSSDTKQRESRQKANYGQVLDSITTPKPTTVQFATDTFDRKNLALALMGKDTDFTQAEETFTDLPVTIGSKGQWYSIGKSGIDAAAITVKTAADAVVDAAGYDIHPELGMIRIKPESSLIKDGDALKISGKTRAASGFKISAASESSYDLEVRIDGQNRVSGKSGLLELPSIVVAVDGEIDWFGADFAKASFSGNVVSVDGQAPYTFTEQA